jgi:hypothetical protein
MQDRGNGPTRPPRWVRETRKTPLSIERLQAAKAAFTTRRVQIDTLFVGAEPSLVSGAVRPRSGDLLMARVDRIGQHGRLELPSGRRARLHVDDEILVVYGDRYAPDQFEAQVPLDLGPTHLVASGGIASTVLSRSAAMRRATEITPIGLVCDGLGLPVNIAEFAITFPEPSTERPPTIAVVGTSMNSGKTTAVQSLVRGARRAGGKPGATKVTGTGSGADYWVMIDAGAHRVVDFTDVGLASTYRMPVDVVEANAIGLIDYLTEAGCSEIVVEVADGLFQMETAHLLSNEEFRDHVDGVVFAASDAMGAVAGARHLLELGLPLLGITGVFTRSPLGQREAIANSDVPVLCAHDLADPHIATMLFKGSAIDLGNGDRPDADTWEAEAEIVRDWS